MAERLKTHLKGCDDETLVFGKAFMPSAVNGHRTDISKEFTEILRKLDYGKEYAMYSLRHSGCVKKWKDGISPYKLMNALGHESFTTTQIYLKGLGIYEVGH